MDESVAVEHSEGTLRGPSQETSRSAPKPRRGPRPLHLPDARSSVLDRVGHCPEARRYDGPATSSVARGSAGPDPGREHDLPFRDPRNAAGTWAPRAHPRDEERGETQTDRMRGPGVRVQRRDAPRCDYQPRAGPRPELPVHDGLNLAETSDSRCRKAVF